tara:strand:+ start:122 stop:457 length:336 start_codon:yes stop_codon:yes gene_type:complete
MRNLYKETFINNSDEYAEKLKKRNTFDILQYQTPVLQNAKVEEYKFLNFTTHIWKTGDKFFKLANQYYEDSQYWWVIALFNEKPTEAHCELGDELYIPIPLSRALSFIGYE